MEAVREKWTDERLDDLNSKVDNGFAEVRIEFRAVRSEMRSEFSSLYRLILGLYATMILGFAGLIASHL